jgi:hypothetical protein
MKSHISATIDNDLLEQLNRTAEPKLTIRDPYICKHMMSAGDNPPIGLLLCTDEDHAMVEYAAASVDNHLFVSKYAVELPTKKELESFLERQRHELEGPAPAPPAQFPE